MDILKDTISIYENTRALELKKKDGKYVVSTNHGVIYASTVVVTTHYPFFVVPGFFPLRSHIEKDYIAASSYPIPSSFSAITDKDPIYSIRTHVDLKSYLLFCGNHKKTNVDFDEKKEHSYWEGMFQTHFKRNPEYLWSTHDIVTNDTLPYIGALKKDDSSLLIATGFNSWGMTNGVIAGRILSDIIRNKVNPYENLFSPTRSFSFQKLAHFFQDSVQNTSSILKTYFHKNKDFYPEQVSIRKENGIEVGVYIDEYGKEHKVRNLCPHMKCKLIFNTFDKTWDCPCHGSRFDIDGNVIEGPSVYSIRIEKK